MLWALAVVPAGIVTVVRARLDLFLWGFLTIGLTWLGSSLPHRSELHGCVSAVNYVIGALS